MLWKEMAWNGVRFSVPAPWEAAKIGPRYLLLADQGEPALEIKWERIQGRFSHQTALKRLRSFHKSAIQESPLPEEWERLLGDFNVTGFAWQAEGRGGRGAILYCPSCGTATLVQFFRGIVTIGDETCRRVLASFRDHDQDNGVRWSVFDIRAELPTEFKLIRYRFDAGRFEMHFGSKRQRIMLYRWGPASTLLANRDLSEFAASTMRVDRGGWSKLTRSGCPAVQWEKPVSGGPWIWCRERLMGNPRFRWFRLWHVMRKNRILGVGAEGDRIFQSEWLNRICNRYDSL